MRHIEYVFLLALPLAGQTASIGGIVVNSVTGAPVPRAHVTFSGSNAGQRFGATSEADGRFSITGLAPGSYFAAAERVGFATAAIQMRDQFTLKADDNKTDLEIKLTPTGTIIGHVTDSDGQPVEGAFVVTLGKHGGEQSPTDERGEFRIGGLSPGKYRVRAVRSDFWSGRPEIRTDGTAEVHNAATYYPGTVSEKEALLVEVRAGQESTGIDIQLVHVPFVRVSGKVVGMPHGAQGAYVTVWEGAGGTGTPVKADGTFEIWRLDPGKYRLTAERNDDDDQVHTSGADIEVAGENIDNIELRVVPDSNISGRLEFEDDRARQAVPKGGAIRRVMFAALENEATTDISMANVAGDDSFSIEKVAAGKYRISLSWDSVYVKSMRFGSSVIDGAVLDLNNGSGGADLSLVLSADTGSVSGTVQDASGSPVSGVRVMLDDRLQIVSKADGSYAFASVPPGEHKIGVADDDAVETVDVRAGQKTTKDLKQPAIP